MPLALLLQSVITTISKGAKKLAPWAVMAYIEELLIDRARGAFMVHWFGTGLPLEGLHIRIAIANLDQLRMRFNEALAERNRRITATGPNLLDPLAGLAGTVAGMLVSPVGQLMAMMAIEQSSLNWWQGLLHMLNWLSGGLLGAGLGVAVIPASVLLGAFTMLVTDPESVRQVYNFLGALAQVMDSAQRFIGLLLGPREAIRNPLLRRILEVADQIANVTMPLIAVVALLITRIGPWLAPLPAQIRAFYGLIEPVQKIMLTLVNDLGDRLLALYKGRMSPYQVVLRMVDTLIAQLPQIGTDLGLLMGEVAAFFSSGWLAVQEAFSDRETGTQSIAGWLSTIEQELANFFTEHPTVAAILRLIKVFKTAAPFLYLPSSSSSSSEGGTLDEIVRRIQPPPLPPPLPDLPALPAAAALRSGLGGAPPAFSLEMIRTLGTASDPMDTPEHQELVEAITRAARRATRPRSYFTAERERLTAELGESPTAALERLYEAQIPFRTDLMRVVETQAAEFVPQLRGVFHALDQHLFQRAEEADTAEAQPSSLFPVRLVPEVNDLRPDIGELRIRVVGVESAIANTWGRSLQAALQGRTYAAEFAPTGG